MEKIAEHEPMIEEALDREKLFLMDMDRRYAYILGWKYRMEESIREAQLKEAEEKCREADTKRRETDEQRRESDAKRRESDEKRKELEEKLRTVEREKALEIAAKFLENGVPAEIISKSSGLSMEEVQDLASRL